MAVMTAQEAAEQAKGLTFEKVWAIFQELGQKQAETDRQFKETGRRIAENSKQLDRVEKTAERVSNNVGGLNCSLGELVETHLNSPAGRIYTQEVVEILNKLRLSQNFSFWESYLRFIVKKRALTAFSRAFPKTNRVLGNAQLTGKLITFFTQGVPLA